MSESNKPSESNQTQEQAELHQLYKLPLMQAMREIGRMAQQDQVQASAPETPPSP